MDKCSPSWVNTWWKHHWQQLQLWVCGDRSLTTLYTLIGQYFPILLYKTVQAQSVCMVSIDWWAAMFNSCHRFSIGLRSGLWLGHSRIFTFLFLSYSGVALAVCFGSLSCWKVNFRPNFSFLACFPLGFFCILLHPFSLLSWQGLQSLLMRNIPITCCYHHHASQSGWCVFGWCAMLSLCQT